MRKVCKNYRNWGTDCDRNSTFHVIRETAEALQVHKFADKIQMARAKCHIIIKLVKYSKHSQATFAGIFLCKWCIHLRTATLVWTVSCCKWFFRTSITESSSSDLQNHTSTIIQLTIKSSKLLFFLRHIVVNQSHEGDIRRCRHRMHVWKDSTFDNILKWLFQLVAPRRCSSPG